MNLLLWQTEYRRGKNVGKTYTKSKKNEKFQTDRVSLECFNKNENSPHRQSIFLPSRRKLRKNRRNSFWKKKTEMSAMD